MSSRPAGLPARVAELSRTAVIGVLNVTPDSFSDGGRYLSADAAIEHGLELFANGADMVDVGGESTRPGATRVVSEEECRRVVPVVAALAEAGVPVSIDTMRADTARAAVEAGACMVNDVSGGLADDAMYAQVARLDVPYVVMHWRGHSANMNDLATYADVVADVITELTARIDSALSAGIASDRIVIDPGLGFAKQTAHNWQLLRSLDRLTALTFPVLLGASRKRFLGALLADETGAPREPEERDSATDAITAIAARHGVWAVRVHDVQGSADAAKVAAAWSSGGEANG